MTTEIEINASDFVMHVQKVLAAVEIYVSSNINHTNAFLKAVTEQGITPENLMVFQEQRLSQFQALNTVFKDTPWAASQLVAPQ